MVRHLARGRIHPPDESGGTLLNDSVARHGIPPETQLALYLLHFYTEHLADAMDVIGAAQKLDDEQLGYFKQVASIAYEGNMQKEVNLLLKCIAKAQT